MFNIGDVIEPREGKTPLLSGAYQVTKIGPTTACLSRLFLEEEAGIVVRYNRTTFVPIELLEMFDLIPLI